jgi:hypothetical protein
VPGSNRSKASRLLDIALTFAIGFLASWRVLLTPGVVGLVHDWSVYPFSDQHVAFARQMFDGWYTWGLGTPVVYPTEYPLRFFLAVLAAMHASGAAISKGFVFASPALAFLLMLQFLRARHLPSPAAYAGGVLYACSPVMLNKLVSGQITYLFSYAFMPLFALAAIRAPQVHRYRALAGVAVGAGLVLASVQLQLGLLAFGMLILALLFARASWRSRLYVFAAALGTAVACELSTLIGVLTSASTLIGQPLAIESPAWFRIQSVDGWDALRLDGYFAHYDIVAVAHYSALWAVAAWGIVAVVLLGLIAAPSSMRYASLIALLILFPIVMGAYSFTGPALQALLLSLPAFDVFRELYHFMAGIAFIYAILFAIGLTWLLRHRFRLVWYGVAVCVLLVFVSPVLTGNAAGLLRTYSYDAYLAPSFQRENAGTTRVVWFPMDEPLAYDGSGTGVDPLSVSRRGSLWLYRLSWPLTVVDTYARMGDPKLKALLQRLSVGDAIERPRFQSVLPAFTVDASAAEKFFRRPLKLQGTLGRGRDIGNGVIDYRVGGVMPMLATAKGIALLPQRISALLQVPADWAPAPFSDVPPAEVPYVMLRDPEDESEEILQAAKLDVNILNFTAVDARSGFAPLSLWWWLHPQYADVPSGLIAIGRQSITASVMESGPLVLVYSWECTPFGGHFRVTEGIITRTVNTACASTRWLSAEVSIQGPISVGFSSTDDRREVVLRNVATVTQQQWKKALAHWHDLLRHALKSESASKASSKLVVVYNKSYGDDWEAPASLAHMPALLGTNLYVIEGSQAVEPIDRRETLFHVAFIVGAIILLAGLLLLYLLLCKRLFLYETVMSAVRRQRR